MNCGLNKKNIYKYIIKMSEIKMSKKNIGDMRFEGDENDENEKKQNVKKSLIKIIINKSKIKKFPDCIKEWNEYKYERVGGDNINCACGKKPIHKLFYWMNSQTGEKIRIGSTCVKKFSKEYDSDEYPVFNEMFKEMKTKEKTLKISKEIENYITLPTNGKYFNVKAWNDESKKFDGDLIKNKYSVLLYNNRITNKYYEYFNLIFKKNPIYKNKKEDMYIKVSCFHDMKKYLSKYNNKINIKKKEYKGNFWWLVVDPLGLLRDEVKHSDAETSESEPDSE